MNNTNHFELKIIDTKSLRYKNYNQLSSYAPGTEIWLKSNSSIIPIVFKVINSETIEAISRFGGVYRFWDAAIGTSLYQAIVESQIRKRATEKGDVYLLEKVDKDNYFSIPFCIKINCTTIKEAISKAYLIEDEINKTIDERLIKLQKETLDKAFLIFGAELKNNLKVLP